MLRRLYSSSLVRSSSIYTASSMLNLVVPFLMMPVLTRYLTPKDYGIVSMFSVLLGIAGPFVGLNLHGAIGVKYVDKQIDLPRYIGNCFYLFLMSAVGVAFVLWLFSGPISKLTVFPREWLWAVVVVSAGQFISSVLMTLWQMEKKSFIYGLFQNLQSVMNIGLSVLLVVGFQKNWQGRIEAQVITMVFFAGVAVYLMQKNGWLKFEYNKAYINSALKFGVPLLPHTMGGMIMTQIDRVFIANMVGIADTGIYSVGYQIGMIIGLLENSFNQAWVPWLFEKLATGNAAVKIKIVKFTYLYCIVILLLAIGLSLCAPYFLSFFVGKEFAGSSKYVVWIALGYAFNGMYKMVSNYIFYAEKTHILAWITFITALGQIGLNYVLISANGAVGAAQATTITLFVGMSLTWVLSQYVYKMPWRLKG